MEKNSNQSVNDLIFKDCSLWWYMHNRYGHNTNVKYLFLNKYVDCDR